MIHQIPRRPCIALFALLGLVLLNRAYADPVTLTVKADQPGVKLDPMFYGYMTEEINYSYDGGLHAQLLPNRNFQDAPPPTGRGGGGGRRGGPPVSNLESLPSPNLVYWSVVQSDGAEGTFNIDGNDPVNTVALQNSLKLDITKVGAGQRVGVANGGYWGIPVKPNTEYKASFYAKGAGGLAGPLTVTIESNDGKTTYASGTVATISGQWQKYNLALTGVVQPTADARFVISANKTGSLWLSLVTLFPPTYNNRPNGNRIDIMQLLVDLKPGFLRFPGGNYLEGNNLAERWAWKNTIGPLENRLGHNNSAWRYRASDGMGMLEFLEWCEDMNAEPVLAVYSGLSLRSSYVAVGDDLKPFVQEALDAIEYVTGDTSTKWGAERAKNGHPESFKLKYVEVGNEEALGQASPGGYVPRFEAFYDAIKAKYPNIKIISAMAQTQRNLSNLTRRPDVVDDHYYMAIPVSLGNAHRYDNYDRSWPKIFVGEWATRVPSDGDTCNMAAGAADAAFLTGLERNADVVIMNCYAPLFVNVNPGGKQWNVDLIGYDTLSSFGSPSYYVQKMFSTNKGDTVIPAMLDPVPTLTAEQLPQFSGGRGGGGGRGPATPPDAIYAVVNRDSASGDLILKLVNFQSTAQPLNIDVLGAAMIRNQASGEVLTGQPGDMNSVTEPKKIAPKPISITNAAAKFSHELPAYSVTVLRLKTR